MEDIRLAMISIYNIVAIRIKISKLEDRDASQLSCMSRNTSRDGNFTRGYGYPTRRVQVRARKSTRGQYPYPTRVQFGSGAGITSYLRVTRRVPE
jgi:hypothetical protein